MKTKLENPGFAPFTVKIVVETEEEARFLWHVTNSANLDEILMETDKYSSRSKFNRPIKGTFPYKLWEAIDEYLTRTGVDI